MFQRQEGFPTGLDSDWSRVHEEEFVHPPLLLKSGIRNGPETWVGLDRPERAHQTEMQVDP